MIFSDYMVKVTLRPNLSSAARNPGGTFLPRGTYGRDYSMSTNDNLPGPQHPSFIRQLILRILPSAVLVLALGFTLVWIIFLGYLLAKLIGLAM